MPERVLLVCDRPGCNQEGQYVEITLPGSPPRRVLVCAADRKARKWSLEEIAAWGRARPSASRRAPRQRRLRQWEDVPIKEDT